MFSLLNYLRIPLCGIVQLTNSAALRLHNWNFTKKGHGFCRHGLKKRKAMGALSIYPWLFWFMLPYQSLLSNGQTNAK